MTNRVDWEGFIMREDFWEYVFIVLFLSAAAWGTVAFVFPEDWSVRYSARYFVHWDNVEIEPRPTACDWGRAPLGDKGCHYEKSVIALSWRPATKKGAPLQVSYDEGKTWIDSAWPSNDVVPEKSIHVSWTRVERP